MSHKEVSFLGDFINGEFNKPLQTNGKLERKNPANISDTIFQGGYKFEHVNFACEAAKKAFRPWADLKMDERKSAILRVKELYQQYSERLAETIAREVGKPLWEAKTEVQAMINKIDVTLNDALPLVEDRKIENASGSVTGYLRFKPRGVMAVIGPFNFPGHLPNGHIIPALISGNTVIFKPSEFAPTTGQLMAEIFEKAQLPKGVFNMIQGNGEVGRRLVMNEFVEGVLFTGSYETGFKIKQDTLTHFWKTCALEMGGKNAAIVWDDCDVNKAVYETLVGAFVTAGQRCTATSRIILRKSVYEKFLSHFHASAKKLTIDDPFKNPFMGPLINAEAQDKYLRFQSIAQRENCEPLMRGKALELDHQGYFVTPSINLVRKLDAESVYQKTEVFGPNVAVYAVEELDEAISIVNSSSYGLALSVFTKDHRVFEKCFRNTRQGIVNWNRATVGASSRLPFGGMGKSGNNQPAGTFAIYSTTYPVASLEDDQPFSDQNLLPGMQFTRQ